MRASAVRDAIIDAIEAATLDTKARSGDVIRVLRTAREPESVAERVAMVRLIAGPDKSAHNTCDAFEVTYQVSIFYSPSDDIEDRIASDVERLYASLYNLHTAAADILDCRPGVLSVSEDVGVVASRRDVTVLFRLDSSLVA